MSLRRAALLLLLILLVRMKFPGSPAVGDEWLPITPEELKMTSEPKAPGAPAIYLYRQVDRKDLGRNNTEYNYVRIKILTEEGRKYGDVEIPYLRERVNIVGIRARTIHPDGTVLNFDGKVYDKMVEKSKGKRIKAKVFTVPDVQVGSIVEYHFIYAFEDGYVFNSNWTVSDDLFTKTAKFTLKPYDKFSVRWEWPAGLPQSTEPPKQGPDHIVRMTSIDVPAFVKEDFMPPENELKFRVLFVYSDELTVELDPIKYWRKFNKTQYDRMESFINKKKEMEAAVSQIVSPSDPAEVRLQKIYLRLEQIRNLSFEPVKTEQEEKRDKLNKIENAADVLKYGYGSGHDITWTFLALARAAGLESYGVMLSRRNEYFFNQKRLNSQELDTNAVLVKVNGKEFYFDPGSRFTPYGLLPWQECYVQGLKLDKEGGSWIQTPYPESSTTQLHRNAKLKLADEGTLEGTVKLTFTGLLASIHRVAGRDQDDEARKKTLEQQLKDYIPASIDVDLTNKPDWTSTEDPLVAEFNVKIPGWSSFAGRRVLLPIGFFSASEKSVFTHTNRVHPICFEYPSQKKDDVTVELPAGWMVASLPVAQDKDAKAAQYTLTVEDHKTAVRIIRTLRSDLFYVPPETYPALQIFYKDVRSGDEGQVVLQPSAVAAGK